MRIAAKLRGLMRRPGFDAGDGDRPPDDNTLLVQELEASRARVVSAADAERKRLERDLHDGAQQQLVLMRLKLGMVGRLVGDDPKAKALHEELKADLDRAMQGLRELAHGIYPPLLESDGLAGALREAAHLAAIQTDVHLEAIGRYRSPG